MVVDKRYAVALRGKQTRFECIYETKAKSENESGKIPNSIPICLNFCLTLFVCEKVFLQCL